MKKLPLYFAVCLFALSLAGCTKVDIWGDTEYIYINESSSEITVRVFKILTTGELYEFNFVIPVKGKHSLIAWGLPREPFLDYDFVTVSNGEKTVTQKCADGDELFFIDSYTTVSEDKYLIVLQYIFTDEFFENGDTVK